MLECGLLRIKIRPQVVLQILADLQDHDALQRDGLPAISNEKLSVVDLLDEVGIEGLLGGGIGGGSGPIGCGDLGEAVALDLEEGDGAGEGGGGALLRGLFGDLAG